MASKTPTQNDDVTPAELADAVVLLGPARMVLDRCAEGRPGSRDEAATMAQRIVDMIGHGVTDEPPHALVERDEAIDLLREMCEWYGRGDRPERLTSAYLEADKWLRAKGAR